MRIGSSTNLLNSQKTGNDLLKAFLELSSGKRSGDPAGLAIAEALQSSIGGLNAANQGIDMSQGALDTASGALTQTSDALHELRDIAVQAANGTLSSTDRDALQSQFDQVLGSVGDIAKTNFNGTNLLDGTYSSSVQTGSEAGQTQDVSIGNATVGGLGLNSVGVSTQSAAQDALSAIDSAISQVDSMQANIGASQNALEFTSQTNSVTAESLSAAKSQISDADLASTIQKLLQAETQQQIQISLQATQQESEKSLTKKLFG